VVVGCVGCTLCSRAFAAAKLAVMATVSSFGPGQNLMLMRNEMSRSGSLVAMLSSCNPHVGLQGGCVCVCALACLLACLLNMDCILQLDEQSPDRFL
jgi:hypothetical protein